MKIWSYLILCNLPDVVFYILTSVVVCIYKYVTGISKKEKGTKENTTGFHYLFPAYSSSFLLFFDR